jgi:hypothetical protein
VSAVATREPASAKTELRPGEPSLPLFDDRPTLDDIVSQAWSALVAEGTVECLVCGGPLRPDGCAECGSELR